MKGWVCVLRLISMFITHLQPHKEPALRKH